MTNSSNEKLTFEWLRVSEYPAADYPRNFSPITVQCCETPVDGTVSLSLGKVNSVVRRDDQLLKYSSFNVIRKTHNPSYLRGDSFKRDKMRNAIG